MSLKAFHVVFITAAVLMSIGCAVWGFKSYFAPEGRTLDLIFGIFSVIGAVALVVYERFFLKKLKHVSYI